MLFRRISYFPASAAVCAVAGSTSALGTPGLTSTCISSRSFSLLASPTPVCRFDLKKHEMEKRRLRELEKAGIDPEDDEPWVAPEEQQRIDEEAEERRLLEEERRREYLRKRDEEAEEKKKKFKEFRARQIAMSRSRKEANAAAKEAKKAAHSAAEDEEGEDGSAAAESNEGPTEDGSKPPKSESS